MGNRGSLLAFLIISSHVFGLSQKPIIVITASYNNISWVDQYFASITCQQYDNWSLIYIDDNSSDATLARIKELALANNLENKITFIANPMRMGHLCNQYHAIHGCDKNAIILILDGDDWLAHEHVFERINQEYQDENVWLTYGQFWYLKKNRKGLCKEVPLEIIKKNGIREISWRTSHLRTFYAGLFQQIKLETLLYHGTFYPKCADVVTMFAMIEMAGTHIKFIPDILYIYNDDNPLSYHHDPTQQREIEAYLREQTPYQPLKEKIW